MLMGYRIYKETEVLNLLRAAYCIAGDSDAGMATVYNIIFIGMPACGKNLNSCLLQEAVGRPLQILDTGEYIRSHEIYRGTSFGFKVKKDVWHGKLLGDKQITTYVLPAALSELCGRPGEFKNHILYDGFPRSVGQAEYYIKMMNRLSTEYGLIINNLVFHIDIPEAIALAHSKDRKKTKVVGKPKRNDDDPETMERRIRLYQAVTVPALNILDKASYKIITLDGAADVKNNDAARAARLFDFHDALVNNGFRGLIAPGH